MSADEPVERGDARSLRLRRAALPLVLLVAFGLRLVCALSVDLNPRAQNLLDASWYDLVARNVGEGRGYVGPSGQPTAKWPPGYPLLLAAVYRIPGPDILAAKLCNVVLATATCFLVFAIGRRAYGESVGLLAALLFAVSPGSAFYAVLTMSEVAFQFASAVVVYAFLALNRGASGVAAARWLLLGLLIGAATMVRGAGVFFLAVPVAAWWLSSVPSRHLAARGLVLVAGLAIVLLPWTIRNQRAVGSAIPISTNGSWALFLAHSPPAQGTYTSHGERFRQQQFAELMKLPDPQREVELARADLRYALEFALSRPIDELILAPQRLYHLFAGDDFAIRFSENAFQSADGSASRDVRMRFQGLSLLANAYFAVVAVLAAVGFTRVWSRGGRPAVAIPLAVLVFVAAHTVLFVGHPRFHTPFFPLLAILAAVAVDGAKRPWPIRAASAPTSPSP